MRKKHQKIKQTSPISFKRAFGIAIPLCLCSLLLAGAIISITNDLYAFVKPDTEITLSIDTVLDANAFSRLLQSAGVINNAFAFELYLDTRGLSDDVASLTGELMLNSSMSYRELIAEIF